MSEASDQARARNIDYDHKLNVSKAHSPVEREHAIPPASMVPVPLWISVVCMIVVLLGGTYLGARSSSGYQKEFLLAKHVPVYEGPKQDLEDWNDPAVLFAKGGELYSVNCQSCHQSTGMGLAGQYPPLAGSEWVLGSDARVAMVVLNGLAGPIQVKGVTYGAQAMAPFKGLDDRELAAIMTYVRGSWGNTAAPVYPDQVAAAKKKYNLTAQASVADLEKIPDDEMLPPHVAPAAAEGATPPETAGDSGAGAAAPAP